MTHRCHAVVVSTQHCFQVRMTRALWRLNVKTHNEGRVLRSKVKAGYQDKQQEFGGEVESRKPSIETCSKGLVPELETGAGCQDTQEGLGAGVRLSTFMQEPDAVCRVALGAYFMTRSHLDRLGPPNNHELCLL